MAHSFTEHSSLKALFFSPPLKPCILQQFGNQLWLLPVWRWEVGGGPLMSIPKNTEYRLKSGGAGGSSGLELTSYLRFAV